MKERLQIRDIVAECGQEVEGFVAIGETACGPLQFPLVIINGQEDGPVMCFTGGVHATEYAPIDAVMRLVQELQPEKLRGAIIAVPVMRMRMFENRTGFVSPLDGLNLNKIAPGRKDGSITEILAHVMLGEIIGAAEYHIDFHAGDLGEILLAFAGYSLTGNREQDEKGKALVRAFTPELMSLSTREKTSIPPFAATLNYEAARNGVVSILAESGGNGTLEEADVQVHLDGAHNVLRHLGMIDGSPVIGPRTNALDRVIVRATRGGLVRLKVQLGDEIKTGQEVAEICNVFGEVVERVKTPGAGIVGLIWAHKVVNTGDPIVRYWITEAA
ncbi:MAG: succinylglutamate desuccinylase/aspartoacylase family protein [Thermomicrobiales bacterium]